MSGKDSLSAESEDEGVDEWFDRAWVDSKDVDDLFGGGADRSVEVAKSEDRSRSPHRIAPDMRSFQEQGADCDHVPMVLLHPAIGTGVLREVASAHLVRLAQMLVGRLTGGVQLTDATRASAQLRRAC